MTRTLTASLLALALAGCGPLAADEFRKASPSRQGINIKVPEGNGQALTSEESELGTSKAALGQTAEWYKATRAITVVVNGGTAWVLGLCEAIIKYPPTTVTADEAIWGPWTDALSPNTYKYTVKKLADGTYDYVLAGKPKTGDDTKYVSLIVGHHVPGAAQNTGSGTFEVDWNAAQTLPEHGKEVGSADFTYSRNEKMDVNVGVAFRQIKDDQSAQLIDADYAFTQASGADGSFEFVVKKDLHNNGSLLERFAVKSRWHNDGAGRSDIDISGGDLGAQKVTASECWGSTFLRTFYTDSAAINPTEGAESACVFTPASYTTLAN
jgi:hypothetical protein